MRQLIRRKGHSLPHFIIFLPPVTGVIKITLYIKVNIRSTEAFNQVSVDMYLYFQSNFKAQKTCFKSSQRRTKIKVDCYLKMSLSLCKYLLVFLHLILGKKIPIKMGHHLTCTVYWHCSVVADRFKVN